MSMLKGLTTGLIFFFVTFVFFNSEIYLASIVTTPFLVIFASFCFKYLEKKNFSSNKQLIFGLSFVIFAYLFLFGFLWYTKLPRNIFLRFFEPPVPVSLKCYENESYSGLTSGETSFGFEVDSNEKILISNVIEYKAMQFGQMKQTLGDIDFKNIEAKASSFNFVPDIAFLKDNGFSFATILTNKEKTKYLVKYVRK